MFDKTIPLMDRFRERFHYPKGTIIGMAIDLEGRYYLYADIPEKIQKKRHNKRWMNQFNFAEFLKYHNRIAEFEFTVELNKLFSENQRPR